jgi:perosamine synthetase
MSEFIPAAKPIIGDEERAAVDAVLASGMLAQGAEVATFEQEFSDVLLDGRAVVAVNSGTAGQHLGLLASGVGPGDEVIVPSFTFAATANSVALTGATPVFADIEPNHFCLDPADVASRITERTVGIMPVHLYGHPADMNGFEALAAKHGLALYEDAAQAHGASLDGRKVGTFGRFAMFSLYPTKNMTSGEGGMVSTGDAGVERMLRLLRNQGMEKQYENEVVGFNARMTNIHAAIGRVQLTKVLGWTETSRAWSRRRSPPGPSTSTTSTRSGSPRTATASRRRCASSTGSARACTTRSRTTDCRRSGSRSTCPRPSGPRARCCRFRCTRRCPRATSSASSPP